MSLRGRTWELRIGRLRIAGDDAEAGSRPLTVEFDITKSLGREPNKAQIRVANLSRRRREQIEGSDATQIQLIAGYSSEGQSDTIFVGDAREIYSTRDSTEIWTTIEAEDGGRAYRRATITATLRPNVSLASVIAEISSALGVGVGNSRSIAASAELTSGGSIFPDGLALEGPAWRAMDMVCRSAGLRWSVQAGVLQLRTSGRPAGTGCSPMACAASPPIDRLTVE